jgi:hypothetical protein
MALISLRSVAPARELCSLAESWPAPPQPIAAPIAAYPGQSFDPLYSLISNCQAEAPPIQLQLGMVEDATVIVKSGFDGLILNKSGVALKETSYYSKIYPNNIDRLDLEVEGLSQSHGDIFVAFDGAWWVYYHWLFSCLGAAGIANKVLPDATSIAVPDWAACGPGRPSVISRRVFNEVKRVVEPRRLLSLPDGAYHARRAYFLFVEGGQPSDAALHPLYRDVFSGLRRQTNAPPRSRLFISRGGRDRPTRVTASDEKIFDQVMVDYNLKKVSLENLSFQAQIDRFADASVIVAPHGSGLANLVFAAPGAKVIELQTEFQAPGVLLPWFYQLAAASGLGYAFLNRDAGDFRAERLAQCLKALDVSRPHLNPLSRAWRSALQRLGAALAGVRRAVVAPLNAVLHRLYRRG